MCIMVVFLILSKALVGHLVARAGLCMVLRCSQESFHWKRRNFTIPVIKLGCGTTSLIFGSCLLRPEYFRFQVV
jgi:hypothetical protein